MFFVYAISSLSANYIYVGLIDDIKRRINQHNSGYERTTRPYAPFKLLLTETFPDRMSARLREKYYKTAAGKSKLRKLRNNDGAGLPA